MRGSSGISGAAAGGVEAVDRAIAILRCFTEREPTLTLTRIAEATGFYKSTVLRLAASLEAGGLLVRQADKAYALGAETMRLASVFQQAFRLEAYVRPVLRRLLAATGESASFFRREGDMRLCLFREDTRHGVREAVREGDMLSLDRGAAGHVLRHFATAPGAERQRLLRRLPLTSRGERDADTAAMAVPVFSHAGQLIGALSLSGPITRFDAGRVAAMAPPLLEAGRDLSATLGGGEAWAPHG
nr:helix-turn-helix domain-containing protein [Plastoroseomonas hellenica]